MVQIIPADPSPSFPKCFYLTYQSHSYQNEETERYKPYWDFANCPTNVFFRSGMAPIQNRTLHLGFTSPSSPQSLFVFNDRDTDQLFCRMSLAVSSWLNSGYMFLAGSHRSGVESSSVHPMRWHLMPVYPITGCISSNHLVKVISAWLLHCKSC